MKGTQHLRDLGQRLWLDNIIRDLLGNATHRQWQYIDELAVTFPATATRIGWQEE